MFKLHPELKKRYWGGNFWSSGKFFRSVGNVTADTIKHYIKDSQGKPKAKPQLSESIDLGNEDLTISESENRCVQRAARSIPHPLGWGGRTQLILKPLGMVL